MESASEELRHALGMTPSEMERAAYRLLNEKFPVHFEAHLDEIKEFYEDKDHEYFNHS